MSYEPMRFVTEVRRQIEDVAEFRQSNCATVHVKLISSPEGDFANKPFCAPVETRFPL